MAGTEQEYIFERAGSPKHIRELHMAFDRPPLYGKGFDWSGYTVWDAASLLLQYLLQLPESIIPVAFQDRFRSPLRGHQAQVTGPMEGRRPSVDNFDEMATLRVYQALIQELLPLSRQPLLYLLDLLAVFASKSRVNKMTTQKLAALFQPGILGNSLNYTVEECRLSQDVLIFLIEYQDHLLISMSGN